MLPLLIALSALVGCSVYPIPDDVTPLKTEEIVRHGRCEMRAAVIERIAQGKKSLSEILGKPTQEIRDRVNKWMEDHHITDGTLTRDKAIVALVTAINAIVKDQQKRNKDLYDNFRTCPTPGTLIVEGTVVVEGKREKRRVTCPRPASQKKNLEYLHEIMGQELKDKLGKAQGLRKYLEVAVVYEFEFEITEQNQTKGDVAFKLPLVSQTVDADASAGLLLTRKGKRTFAAQDKWGALITTESRCEGFSVASKNALYPLGGSIGVDRVVTTFMALIDQGGAKESFVDTLVFTTDVSGGINATIKLSPVPHAFRLVSAGAHLFGSRVDVHKLTLSLVFPKADSSETIFGVERFEGDLETPFSRPADWRARYNLCVADARGREDTAKQLRLTAPEIYCIQYADAFDPQYGRKVREDDQDETATKTKTKRYHHHMKRPPPPRAAPPSGGRENYIP